MLASSSRRYSGQQYAEFERLKLQPAMMRALGHPTQGLLQNELMLIRAFGVFLEDGRKVYEFNPVLSSVLANAPFDDIAVSDLSFLEGGAYFHFGPIPELLHNDVQYEGAYVTYEGSRKALSALAIQAGAYRKKPNRFYGDDAPEIFPLFLTAPTQTLTSAMADTEREVVTRNEKQIAQFKAQCEELRRQYGTLELPFDAEAFYQATKPIPAALYNTVIRLALGATAFLVRYPNDYIEAWPSDIPASALATVSSVRHRARAAVAQAALDNEGYIRVRFVGSQFVSQHQNAIEDDRPASTGTGTKKATHPRTFFWRNQACGKGYSEHKPTLVRQTIVNPGGPLAAGRVYQVGGAPHEPSA
ncbi:hypothetical protein AB4Y45_35765 [Paraburkholderia sp. EG287A]|uniref:hypothetical protein n=1 Tax=Paraburkholderia sp. EG287A TaxID=3237012 RepID=UPI0034D3866F